MVNYAILIIALPLLVAFLIPLLAMINKNLPKFMPLTVSAFNAFLSLNLLFSLNKTGKVIIVKIGGFNPPFGINLYIGYLAVILLLLISLTALLVSIYTINTVENAEYRYYMLFILLIMGISGLVVTGDLFNMFVFLEITSISSYSLTAYKRNGLSLEAAMKYILIGSLASVFVLIGIATLYYATHTLNIADISRQISSVPLQIKMFALSMLLIGVAIEAELFPVNGWVPDVYQASPTPITTLFSSIVVKAMIYVFFRILFTIFRADTHIMDFVMILGLITLLIGEISALKQTNIKRMLAYSSIGQVGLIVVAVSSLDKLGISGGIYQMINHAVFKGVLFLATAYMVKSISNRQGNISDLKGIHKKMPYTSFLVAFSIIALLGVPPLAGFWAKMYILGGLMTSKHYFVAIAVLTATIIEAVYYLKFIFTIYTDNEIKDFKSVIKLNKALPVLTFGLAVVLFSALPYLSGNFRDILYKAANEFINVSSYISNVLGS